MQVAKKKRVRGGGKKARRAGITLRASVEEPKGRRLTAEEIERLYKPKKKRITLRLDADVLEWFRKQGGHYQTRINRALRKVMKEEMDRHGS
jgi:uncharacterized protein (DUF4415 family)